MGEALLRGLLKNNWSSEDELHVVEPVSERRDYLAVTIPGISISEEPLSELDSLVAVKPDKVPEVLEILSKLNPTRVLSIAAGVKVSSMEKILGEKVRVLRAMPNTPALIGKGSAGVAAGSSATDEDLVWAVEILSAVGSAMVVEESQLDAVTGISGSGPAYLFFLAEALIDAGCEVGLSKDEAQSLVEQTLLGAAALLYESDDPAEALRQKVTSKGGTTAAAIEVFENASFRDTIRRAVFAATERSLQLGDE
jgi:pyrroline-5-carboxylate reductase